MLTLTGKKKTPEELKRFVPQEISHQELLVLSKEQDQAAEVARVVREWVQGQGTLAKGWRVRLPSAED